MAERAIQHCYPDRTGGPTSLAAGVGHTGWARKLRRQMPYADYECEKYATDSSFSFCSSTRAKPTRSNCSISSSS